jgi:hypothetical protein
MDGGNRRAGAFREALFAPAPARKGLPMSACAIRYRLEGSGPSALLVDCDGQLRIYTQGVLGGTMPRGRLLAILAERGCRWIPATGQVDVDLSEEARPLPLPPGGEIAGGSVSA